jgi:hypothetical protein
VTLTNAELLERLLALNYARAAAASTWSRAGSGSRISFRLPALAGIRPAVETSTGNGGRSVRSALGILAHPEAPPAHRIPYARLGQVQPERSEFETAAESPSHDPAIV